MKHSWVGGVVSFIAIGLIMLIMVPVLMGARMTTGPAASAQPQTIPTPSTAQPIDALTVDIYFLDAPRTFSAETIFAERLDQTPEGYYITFTQEGLNEYVTYWFADDFLEENPNIRAPTLRLEQGRVTLEAEVHLALGWQPLRFVYNLNPDQQTLSFAGLWVGEQFYTTAPGSFLQGKVTELETATNDALTDLRLMHPTQGEQTIAQIYIGEQTATIITR